MNIFIVCIFIVFPFHPLIRHPGMNAPLTTTPWIRKQHFQIKLIDILSQQFNLGWYWPQRAFGNLCVHLFCFVLCLFCFTSNNDSGQQFAFSGFTDAKKTLHHHTPLRDNELEHQAFHPLEHFTTGLERIGEGIWFFTLHLNKDKHNLTKSQCPEEKTLRGLEFQNSF